MKKINFFLVFGLIILFTVMQNASAETTLLSQGKECTASSTYADYTASKVTDGDIWEGWLADPAESNAFVYVDLGSVQNVNRVKIYWGGYDFATSYKVQTSTDLTTWIDNFTSNNGDGGSDDISFEAITARYVRVYCLEKADWSYEIYEMQVYGDSEGSEGAAPGTPTGLVSSNITSSSATLSWNSVSGATGYKLYRGNTIVYTGANLSYTDSSLTISTVYTYKVSATNSYGESTQSLGINVTTVSNNPIVYHDNNHAYLNSEWFDSTTPLTDAQITTYVNQLKQYNIQYLFCDIGIWKKNDTTEIHLLSDQYADLAHWIKIAKQIDPNLKIIATLNSNLKSTNTTSYFVNSTAPYAEKTFGTTVKNEVGTLVYKLCKTGLLYNGNYYKVDGIHIDFEPFKVMYQTYFSNILTVARNNMEEGQHLSCATPAKNGLWSNNDTYTTTIINKVDMVNPMIYDCQGPSSWGTVEDGVAQNSTEYIKILKDTCIWLSSLIAASSNTDCQLSPIIPVYEDMGYDSSPEEGWPDADSYYIWYHLNSIENMSNALTGVRQAMTEGANIHSAGIFWWPNFIGEQPSKYSNYASDQITWMNEWVYTP